MSRRYVTAEFTKEAKHPTDLILTNNTLKYRTHKMKNKNDVSPRWSCQDLNNINELY